MAQRSLKASTAVGCGSGVEDGVGGLRPGGLGVSAGDDSELVAEVVALMES